MDQPRHARRGLLVFFAVLLPLSGFVEALIVRRMTSISRVVLILLLMWVPALASVVARLAVGEGFRDLSPRLGDARVARALLIAAGFPLLVGAIAYGLAWSTGLAAFVPPAEDPVLFLPSWVLPLSGPPAARFGQSLALHLTVGAVSGCVFAAGEELGWRGYLAPRLLDARVPWALPLSGLIWAMWHWPLYYGSASPHRQLSLLLFTLGLIPIAGLMARLRLESGSVWPPILLHGLWNELLGVVFAGFTPDEGIWLGEPGILVVGTVMLLSLPLLWGRWAARRTPGEAPYAELGFLSPPEQQRDPTASERAAHG